MSEDDAQQARQRDLEALLAKFQNNPNVMGADVDINPETGKPYYAMERANRIRPENEASPKRKHLGSLD